MLHDFIGLEFLSLSLSFSLCVCVIEKTKNKPAPSSANIEPRIQTVSILYSNVTIPIWTRELMMMMMMNDDESQRCPRQSLCCTQNGGKPSHGKIGKQSKTNRLTQNQIV